MSFSSELRIHSYCSSTACSCNEKLCDQISYFTFFIWNSQKALGRSKLWLVDTWLDNLVFQSFFYSCDYNKNHLDDDLFWKDFFVQIFRLHGPFHWFQNERNLKFNDSKSNNIDLTPHKSTFNKGRSRRGGDVRCRILSAFLWR